MRSHWAVCGTSNEKTAVDPSSRDARGMRITGTNAVTASSRVGPNNVHTQTCGRKSNRPDRTRAFVPARILKVPHSQMHRHRLISAAGGHDCTAHRQL